AIVCRHADRAVRWIRQGCNDIRLHLLPRFRGGAVPAGDERKAAAGKRMIFCVGPRTGHAGAKRTGGVAMADTASAMPWYSSLNRGQGKTLRAAHPGWMLAGEASY